MRRLKAYNCKTKDEKMERSEKNISEFAVREIMK